MNFMPSPATMPSEGLQIQEDREELCQGTDTHPKRRLMGRAAAASRTGAQLHFAPWTCICSGGFDGRRPKGVPVKIIGQQTGYERPLLFVCFRQSYPIQQRGYAFYKARLMRRMGAAQPSSAWGSRHNNQQDGTRPGLRAMLVICEECAQKYKVDERQMRGDRARFTCQKCGHPVIVRREDAAPGRPHGESRIPIVETSY